MKCVASIDDAKIVSPYECIQIELGLRLGPYEYSKIALLRWSPVWCLPQRLRCQSQYQKAFFKEYKEYQICL